MSQTLSRGNRRRSKAFVARSSASTRRSVPSVLIGLARWRGLSALARIVVKLRNSLASHDKRAVRETATGYGRLLAELPGVCTENIASSGNAAASSCPTSGSSAALAKWNSMTHKPKITSPISRTSRIDGRVETRICGQRQQEQIISDNTEQLPLRAAHQIIPSAMMK